MASSTRLSHRIFAGAGAVLFLGSACALTAYAIWQTTQSGSANNNQTQTSTHKLQGTKLKNFTPTTNVPKLETVDTVVGTGQTVKPGDTVTVDYTGAVAATGVIFQSSLDTGKPATFNLNGVIKGWTEGLPGMKVGGTRRLIIPASLAYGATPPQGAGIPANANLVFDITLHSISK